MEKYHTVVGVFLLSHGLFFYQKSAQVKKPVFLIDLEIKITLIRPLEFSFVNEDVKIKLSQSLLLLERLCHLVYLNINIKSSVATRKQSN